jgi:hypothetical protein
MNSRRRKVEKSAVLGRAPISCRLIFGIKAALEAYFYLLSD